MSSLVIGPFWITRIALQLSTSVDWTVSYGQTCTHLWIRLHPQIPVVLCRSIKSFPQLQSFRSSYPLTQFPFSCNSFSFSGDQVKFPWRPAASWRREQEEERAAARRRSPFLAPLRPVSSSPSVGSVDTWRMAGMLDVLVLELRSTWPPFLSISPLRYLLNSFCSLRSVFLSVWCGCGFYIWYLGIRV